MPIPDNPWPGKAERFSSIQAACKAGVAAQIANGEIYDRLLAATQRQDTALMRRN